MIWATRLSDDPGGAASGLDGGRSRHGKQLFGCGAKEGGRDQGPTVYGSTPTLSVYHAYQGKEHFREIVCPFNICDSVLAITARKDSGCLR